MARSSRPANARAAHGATLGQCARAGGLPGDAIRIGTRPLPRATGASPARARAEADAGRLRWHAVLRALGRGGRGRPSVRDAIRERAALRTRSADRLRAELRGCDNDVDV